MYEDSVGIPMTLSGPGVEPGVNATPVSLVDMAATIEFAVTGETIENSNGWQGRPLHSFINNPDTQRPVLSEYHDGGSPCGFFMLRTGRWKYVYFSEGHPALLFDISEDPQELENLIDNSAYSQAVDELRHQLFEILDPEEVNQRALADQNLMIEKLGGMEAILALPSFNHTPLE